jgi:hypothetical protein
VSDFDIIGDVHGCATKLVALLDALGYGITDWTGAYWHPHRRAIFVGDLIDRGDEQIRVLEIVKGMVDGGSAEVVMGNHEFNAVAYATEHPAGSGQFLRPHIPKNYKQHRSFLDQVTGPTRALYLEWFKTLPLWLDLGGVRIIHACWHQPSIELVGRLLGSNRFNSMDQFVRASDKTDPLYGAVDALLKGPEISLVDHGQLPFVDKDGHVRSDARLRWWNEGATTLREIAELSDAFTTEDGRPYPPLPDIEIGASERSYAYDSAVPVFYGHYWRQGSPKFGLDWTAHTACVDFSAVKGGTLTAYRWSGETEIDSAHYVQPGVDGLSVAAG